MNQLTVSNELQTKKKPRVTIRFKIIASSIFTILLVLSILGLTLFFSIGAKVHEKLEMELSSVSNLVTIIVNNTYNSTIEHLDNTINHLERNISDDLSLDPKQPITYRAVNQITKEEKILALPGMFFKGKRAMDIGLFDEISLESKTNVTLFQLFDDGMIRVNTSVKDMTGKKAIGTYIPSSSPVYMAIVKGDKFVGRALVVDQWNFTAYKPLYIKGQLVGALFAGIPENSNKNLSDTFDKIIIGKKGYSFILNSKGDAVLHPELQGKNLYDKTDVNGKYIFREIIDKKNGRINYLWKNQSDDKPSIKTVIFQYFPEMEWILCISYYPEEFHDLQNLVQRIIPISIIFAIILFSIMISILTGFLFKAIPILNKSLNDIASGNGDLTRTIDYINNDEMGDLSRSFNQFVNSLKQVIMNIKAIGNKTLLMGNDLAASSEEVSATLEEIAATMNSMESRIIHLNDEIKNARNAVESIHDYIKKEIDAVSDQSAAVNESSASIEEMIANIHNITRVTEAKKSLIDSLSGMAREGIDGMDQTVQSIDEIARSTEIIFEMINVINNVAEQTNLLAMNAAIEAAHAGEFGKGFSVVADEIRKLAETTANNSKNISSSLQMIVDKIKTTQETTVTTNDTISKIIEGTTDISASMNETLQGLKEVSIGTGQILESLNVLNRITEDVRNSANEMGKRIVDVDASIKNVNSISEENRTGMQEVTIGINEISKTVVTLSELSEANSSNIRELENEIGKFKTE